MLEQFALTVSKRNSGTRLQGQKIDGEESICHWSCHCLVAPMGLLIAPIQKTIEVEITTLDILQPLFPDQYQHMQK